MNVVYVIAPPLTIGASSVATAFFKAFEQALQEFRSVSGLYSQSALRDAQPDAGDVVVFFNRPDHAYDALVLKFLNNAILAGSVILPVAASESERTPPSIVHDKQSFDIVDHLRQRALSPGQVATIATVFARQVMAIHRPTLCEEPMRLFLSHRRFDGEEITAHFQNSLRASAQNAFRDLFDIRAGEDAQEIIEARLRESDAVIFLDTPQAAHSYWISKEIQMALSLQLPIVWVRVGGEQDRASLPIKPSDNPHFQFSNLSPAADQISTIDVEKIIQKAFEIHHRDYVDRLLDEFSKLKDLARQHEIQLMDVDSRRMIFSIAIPRKSDRYRQRPLTHLLQLFGRTPTGQDLSKFSDCARDAGYEPHPKHGAHYDSAILLAAIPSQPSASFNDCGVHIDSIGDYVAALERSTAPRPTPKAKRLVISGAFADCEPEFQQNMTNAVHAVVESSLRAGVAITFGAHPTFQFMIFDLAKRLRPDDYLSALRMYISRHFVTEPTIDELRNSAEVVAIDKVAAIDARTSRAESLTAMRRAMLGDGENGALVVIGGKTSQGGHEPGVDEEIELARVAGLPVYIFGSVGGRSSEITATTPLADRNAMNTLSEDANNDLATSFDYSRLAKLIVDAL